jgi:hypothetical protein
MLVASPRNQLFAVSGGTQHPGQIALQRDLEALATGLEQGTGGFRKLRWAIGADARAVASGWSITTSRQMLRLVDDALR